MRFLFLLVVFFNLLFSQSMKLIFVGDIMGHHTQIKAAYNSKSDLYSYDSVFRYISPLLKRADYTIANLELTFAGEPYSGFPQFSSPDALAEAINRAGINVLVTANNHSADRGCRGIKRTIDTLNSIGVLHTGTFVSSKDRDTNNLLILSKDNIKVGLLNYTQDTNGIYVKKPCIVNRISKDKVLKDITNAKSRNIDKLIVFLHWGEQYKHTPNRFQKRWAKLLLDSGVDIVIGSHPHVIQPVSYTKDKNSTKIVAYSLGNFLSNQQRVGRSMGLILELEITKDNSIAKISNAKYYLSYVHKYYPNGKRAYEILPCCDNLIPKYKRYEVNSYIKSSENILKSSNLQRVTTLIDTKNISIALYGRVVKDELIVP